MGIEHWLTNGFFYHAKLDVATLVPVCWSGFFSAKNMELGACIENTTKTCTNYPNLQLSNPNNKDVFVGLRTYVTSINNFLGNTPLIIGLWDHLLHFTFKTMTYTRI